MKITPGLIGWAIAAFVWSLFMGVTAISIGIGAAFPPANLIAKPFVCPNGKMQFNQETSNPLPGTTYTTTSWVCIDYRTEVATDLELFPMSLYAGLIYGLLLFVVVAAIWLYAQRGNLFGSQPVQSASWVSQPASPPQSHRQTQHRQPQPGPDAVARMAELKKLRAADMISEAEYEQKRAEILRNL